MQWFSMHVVLGQAIDRVVVGVVGRERRLVLLVAARARAASCELVEDRITEPSLSTTHWVGG